MPDCAKPLRRRVLPSGRFESLADFVRRSYCSPECSRRSGVPYISNHAGADSVGRCHWSMVVSNDMRSDERYLRAFESPGSEMIVPSIDPNRGRVVGTIDLERSESGAFCRSRQRAVERSAAVIWDLFGEEEARIGETP
jgi:hypothetical protein